MKQKGILISLLTVIFALGISACDNLNVSSSDQSSDVESSQVSESDSSSETEEIVEGVEGTFILDSELAATYLKGQYFNFPNAYYVHGGEKYKASRTLTYPSGGMGAYDGENALLTEVGEYTLRYEVTIGEESFEKVCNFTAVNNLAAQFVYGPNVKVTNNASLPDYFGSNDGKPYAASDVGGHFWSSVDKGIQFTVETGAEPTQIKYDNVIDLAKLGFTNDYFSGGMTGSYEEASQSFLEFVFTPSNAGKLQVDTFEIILTDIYDESNYVVINMKPDMYDSAVTNIAVSAKNMYTPVGTSATSAGWGTGTLGTFVHSTMAGRVGDRNSNSISLFYDYEDNEMNVHPIFDKTWPLMLDFNNEHAVGIGNQWSGFTTGEVYLSFNIESIIGNEMSFTVLSIGGNTVESEKVTDKIELRVNSGDFDSAYDYVLSGENQYFEIFDAVAFTDNEGTLNVNKQVYYGYDKQETVLVQDGKFALEKAGVYIIEYTAKTNTDFAKQEIYVVAKDAVDAKDVLQYTISKDIADSGFIGDEIFITNGEYCGGIGTVSVEYFVTKDEAQISINNASRYPSFVLEEVGTYEITVLISDSLGNSLTVTKEINCLADAEPRIVMPQLPATFIIGHTYTVPKAEASYYTADGSVPVAVKTLINGNEANGDAFVVSGDFTLQYVATADGKECNSNIISCEAIAEKTGNEYVATYFNLTTESSYIETTNTGILLSANGSLKNERFNFVNQISDRMLSVQFQLQSENQFEEIVFVATDSANPNNQVEFSFKKQVSGGRIYMYFCINGKYCKNLSGSLGANTPQVLGFTYDKKTKEVLDISGNLLGDIKHFINGKEFVGFTSNNVYLDIYLRNISGESKVLIESLASQVYSSSVTYDSAGPQVLLNDEMASYEYFEVGEQVVLPAAIAYDTFNNVESLTLTITAPDKTTIYSGSIDEDVSFVAEQIGLYTIVYQAKDTSERNNMTSKRIFVNVVNESGPKITLGEYQTTAKVNESYTVASAEVDGDGTTNLIVYILTDKEKKYTVSGDTVKFTEEGTYRICYYALDKFNNYTLISYIVEVTK